MASYDLQIPISEEAIRSLHVGDQVRLYGTMITARDAAHKYIKDTFFKGAARSVQRPTSRCTTSWPGCGRAG